MRWLNVMASLVVGAGLVCAMGQPARAAAIQVSPMGGTGAPGQPFSSEISAKGGGSVGAMQFDLTWDPAVLEFRSLDKGKVLAGGAMVESKLKTPGRLSVAWVAQDSVDAEGPLLTVQFAAKGEAGQKSRLALENLRAWGPDKAHHGATGEQHLIDVLARSDPADFSIGAGSGGKRYWWIGAAVVLVLLLAMALKTRRGTGPAGRAA